MTPHPVLQEFAGGAYVLPSLGEEDLWVAAEVVSDYADLGVDVADASLVVLADVYGTTSILTLDRRHFNVLRPLGGGTFTCFPTDESSSSS